MSKFKNKRRFWSSEKILSISAILVSIGTFAMFAYQTSIMRKQQHMSVYPYLQFANYYNYSTNYKFVLSNKGVGPAIVNFAKISIKGRIQEKDLAFYLGKITTKRKDSVNFYTSNINKGQLIAEKETIEIVELIEGNSLKSSIELYNLMHNDSLDFIIEYESVYGEKWRINMRDNIPERVD